MSASEKTTTAAAGISTLPFHLLPKDIIVDIFSKLPAKSLVRFKCVSKFFCVLITADHGFSVLHRSVSLTLPSRAGILIVIVPRTPHYTRSLPVFYTIDFSEENRRPGKPPQLQANRVGYLDGEPYAIDHLRSSSDGLVCLHRNNRHVVVCNVSTRQRISLPRIPSDSPSKTTYAMLGFDSKSKRYKVLVSAPHRGRVLKYKHWVLTVGVNKSWREINNYNGSHLFYITLDSLGYPNYSDTSVCIDGVIYSYNYNWQIKVKVHPASFGIVAFEVGSESFSVIPLPREILSGNYSKHAFGLLQVDGGRLAIVRKIDEGMDLWTWEKFKKCWERSITSIPLKEGSIINLQMRFTTNHIGEIVLLCININQPSILIYNLKSKIWRKFDVGGVEKFPSFCCDVRMYRTMDNVFSLE